MKNAFIELLKVKTLISLAVIGTTCFLAITAKIQMETFMALTMAIVTFYFTKKES